MNITTITLRCNVVRLSDEDSSYFDDTVIVDSFSISVLAIPSRTFELFLFDALSRSLSIIA